MAQRFSYKAVASGPRFSGAGGASAGAAVIAGEGDAADEAALRRKLYEQGLVPIEIRPAGKRVFPRATKPRAVSTTGAFTSKPMRSRDRQWFFQTFRRLLEGRTPTEEALTTMVELAPTPSSRGACERVRSAVRSGRPLAEAVEEIPGLAAAHYVALLRVGHASGAIVKVVALIDDAMTRRRELTRLVVSRLTYPLIVVTAAIGAVWFLSAYVIPRVAETLASVGSDLPFATRFTLEAASVLMWLAPITLTAGIGVTIAWRRSVMPAGVRQWVEGWLTRAPIVRDIAWTGQAALTCDILATTLEGGGDLLEAMDLAGCSLQSTVLRARLIDARARVREGGDIGEALHNASVLPPLVSAIVRTGVRSCDITGAFRRGAQAAAQRQDEVTQRLSMLLEPAIILMLAALVGWVMYSLVAGMLTIYDLGGI